MLLDALHGEILRIALYFDVFGHPLARGEVVRLVRPQDAPEVHAAVETLIAEGRLVACGAFLALPGREEAVPRRRERSREAERAWPTARRAAAVLARWPFVRGVLVTGGMAKGSHSADSDVDFLLVVEPGRLWVLKTLLQVFRRALPERARECFCTNYMIAADRLVIDEQNVFIAVELATAVPMYGPEACTALLEANRWGARFVPGWDWSVQRATQAPDLPPRRGSGLFERALRDRGDALDRTLLERWSGYWDRKYAWMDDAQRQRRFKRRSDVATNHMNDFQGWVLSEWHDRLRRAGITEP